MTYFKLNHYRSIALAATLAIAGASVHAEPNPPAKDDAASQEQQLTPAQRKQLESFRAKRDELMQLGQELEQIRQAAVQKHPELKKQEEAFGNMVAEEMKSNGGTPHEDLAELRELQSKLQDKGTPEADRQALMARLQRKAQEFEQARRKALENPKLQKAQGDLLKSMVEAMKEQDSRTEQIMQQMKQKQQEMLEIRKAAQAEAGGQKK